MHDIIPKVSKDEQRRSMGFFIIWWIESFCVVGSKPEFDKPIHFTPEYCEFLVDCYALDKHGRRLFDRVFLSRPKGSNKSGNAAYIGLAEGLAPCRFDHWAEPGETYTFLGQTYEFDEGEPVGRMIVGPDIACIATAESQTGNVYGVMEYNCENGPLSELRGYGLDPGATRISLPDGGVIHPVTSGGKSADGGLQTFLVADETHLYNTPKLWSMFNTLKRNLAKRSADQPWLLETTTMFRPGEESVAEATFRKAWAVAEHKTKHEQRVLFDHRYANLKLSEIGDEKKLMHGLMESYGSVAKSHDGRDYLILPDGRIEPVNPKTQATDDGFTLGSPGVEPGPSKDGWMELEGPKNDIFDSSTDVSDSIRYYLNNLTSVTDAWIPEEDIQSHVEYQDVFEQADWDHDPENAWMRVISKTDEITLGFDGSISDDATALVGCRVRDGLLFLIKLEQKPDEAALKADWRVDRDAFDGKVRWMFDRYNVVGFFADVNPWESMIASWESSFSHRLKVFPRGKNSGSIRFFTNNWSKDVYQTLVTMAGNFKFDWEPVQDGDLPQPGAIALFADPRLINHFRNARRRDRSFGYLVFKETPNSPKKIDAAMAGILAYAARMKLLSKSDGEDDEAEFFLPVQI
ncbi:MAG: hypothetical protein SOI13_01580 [Bifidobacterium mongoliense]|jgi:hypothetical protein|uniref:hypothetical protein n=1 Tax=Bifidobacterium mongoliense TaxID=518643 RepID=UPI002F3565D8